MVRYIPTQIKAGTDKKNEMNCTEKHVLFRLWVLSIPSVVCPFQYCSQSRQCVRRLVCRELPLTCLVLDGVVLVEKKNHEINNKHMTHTLTLILNPKVPKNDNGKILFGKGR